MLPNDNYDTLSEVIDSFHEIASTLKRGNCTAKNAEKSRCGKEKTDVNDLKSLAMISKLPNMSAADSPPAVPPPPVPPPPTNYTPSPPPLSLQNLLPTPPPPPVRAHPPSKPTAPPPPKRSDQTKEVMRRLHTVITASMKTDDNDDKKVSKSSTGTAVENLDTLLADMESFNNSDDISEKIPVGSRKVKIEVESEDEQEKTLDNLTNKLFDDIKEDETVDEHLGDCNKCLKAIKETAVLAGSSTFHQDCFTCTHCGLRLGGKFFSVDNAPYCEDHKEVGLDTCLKCGERIKDGAVTVKGESFHPACFKCAKCGLRIEKKFFHTEDDMVLCEADYQETREKCSHCGLAIMDRMLSAVGQKFHPNCFRCALCDVGLDGVPFLLCGNSINCQSCYTKYKAPSCAKCGDGIVSTGTKKTTLITCNGQSFHQECYTCEDCQKNLCGEFVCCNKGDIVCFACDTKRRD